MANYTAPSIYDIPLHNSEAGYTKNAVVMTRTDIGSSLIPKSLRYYYAIKTVPATASPGISIANLAYWGGYTIVNNASVPLFLWTPSYNVATTHAPKVNSVTFGNGYEQRIPDGIYTGLIKMEMTFEMRSDAEAKAILHFLRARKGASSFVIKNLPEIYGDSGYKKRFICPSFNSTFAFYNNHSIKASFSETNN